MLDVTKPNDTSVNNRNIKTRYDVSRRGLFQSTAVTTSKAATELAKNANGIQMGTPSNRV